MLLDDKGFITMKYDGFVHSPLDTFPDRVDCLLCQYLWSEDIATPETTTSHRRLSEVNEVFTNKGIRLLVHIRVDTIYNKRGILDIYFKRHDGLPLESHLVPWKFTLHITEPMALKPPEEWFTGSETWPSLSSDMDASLLALETFDWKTEPRHIGKSLRQMLNKCREEHEQCRSLKPAILPTRVLRISVQDSRLCIQLDTSAPGQTGDYVALSYCWGGPQEFRLTKDNLTNLQQKAFDMRVLPKTLQDAALMTHYLGIDYLWIDALCIIQDDPADKQVEIANMYHIYEQSFVTLVAAMASSVKDGFLKPTAPLELKGLPNRAICLPLTVNNGNSMTEMALLPSYRLQTDASPINERGWTFQESLIPRRLVVFENIEPFVRCRRDDIMTMSGSLVHLKTTQVRPARLYGRENTEFGFSSTWQSIMEQYSLRKFTVAEDRLFALLGVIDMLRRSDKGEYYYGVWTLHAIGYLMWLTPHSTDTSDAVRLEGVPTWSWQSISSPIECRTFESERYDYLASVDFAGDDGEVLKLTTCALTHKESDHEMTYWPDINPRSGSEPVNKSMQDQIEEGKIELLLFAHGQSDERFIVLCVSDEGLDGYRRIGLMWIHGQVEDWLSLPKKTWNVR
jgi:hypothetical protein